MKEDRVIGTYNWGNNNAQTFLYGTDLSREGMGQVQFVNHLMPAGTTIHEWYSFTDYQLNRDIPLLPFLYDGKTYRIEVDIESVPKDTFLLEILFFDRSEDMVERKVLYAPDYSFVYPADNYYYTIRLINAGCNELVFRNFKLIEVAEND